MVIIIGRWSDCSFFSVVQKVSIASDGVQKVMSMEDGVRPAWGGM